jgi:hypothetical protein
MIETNQKGGLMVWGVISKNGSLHLICMEGSITADAYIDMLEEDFLSEANDGLLHHFIFMHDIA